MLLFSEILIVGGYPATASMEYYSTCNAENHLANQTMIAGRFQHVSALMNDGRIMTAGGNDENWDRLSTTELFDWRTGRVEAGTNMTEGRSNAAAAVINDTVYVCGGFNSSGFSSTCERFASNNWTETSSMKEKRVSFAMVAVDGKLFAIGGSNRSCLSSVERFDPENGTWQFVRTMQKKRSSHGAAVLNGLIYVCGGEDNYVLRECERYDPQTDGWKTVAPMKSKRSDFKLVAMSGRLYAVGGGTSCTETSVESYDPNIDEWTLLNEPLIEPRWAASAVVLYGVAN